MTTKELTVDDIPIFGENKIGPSGNMPIPGQMNEMEIIRNKLRAPLPAEALKPHPTKSYLTTIKPIYIIERLNDVFGIGGWVARYTIIPNTQNKVAMLCVLTIDKYNIYIEQFGGNDNPDYGDALKGSATDALTKCASILEIGIDVFKTVHDNPTQPTYTPSRADTDATPELQQAVDEVFGKACPLCKGFNVTQKPAGVSKKTGKPYNAFYVCNDCQKPFNA